MKSVIIGIGIFSLENKMIKKVLKGWRIKRDWEWLAKLLKEPDAFQKYFQQNPIPAPEDFK